MVFHKETLEMESPANEQWNVGQNLMIHELCHAQQFIKYDINQEGHKAGWKRCMTKAEAWGADHYDKEGSFIR